MKLNIALTSLITFAAVSSSQAAVVFADGFEYLSGSIPGFAAGDTATAPIVFDYGQQGTFNIVNPLTGGRLIDIRYDGRGGGNTSILWNGSNALTYSTSFNDTTPGSLTLTGSNQLDFAPSNSAPLQNGAVWGLNYYLVQDGDANSESNSSPVLLGFELIDNNGDGFYNSGDQFSILGAAFDPTFESDLAVNMITSDDGVMARAVFVPEPSRAVLLLTGMLLLGFARRR